MELYTELGRIQFQIDKLEIAKNNIVRQIEIQMTIESINNQKPVEEKKDDSKLPT